MGFDIDYGNMGFLGALVLVCAISMGLIVAFVFITTAKRAHDTVVQDIEDEREAKGDV